MVSIKRPHFSSSIIDLEKLVEDHSSDKNLLNKIKYELTFRKVKRANALAIQVNKLLHKAEPEPTIQKTPPQKNKQANTHSENPTLLPKTDESINKPFFVYDPNKRPSIENHADSILSAWTALEVLSPQTYKKPEELLGGNKWDVIDISKQQIPWEGQPEKSKPNTRLYYYIVLGQIRMSSAIDTLMKVFGDTRPERSAVKDRAALAVITVDKFGRPIEDDCVAVSSFGWGFSQVRQGKMSSIGEWSEAEDYLVEQLNEKLVLYDENDEVKALDNHIINSVYQWLSNTLKLYPDELEPPKFILRKYQWFVLKNAPDPLLLNSFYLSDLDKARNLIKVGQSGKALDSYLGINAPASFINILQDQDQLEKIVAPNNIPHSRWTMNERHSLVLLQQAAVNFAFKELESSGILGVNGPPGTGKTTLLCDHIAGVVLDRAKQMVSFNDPEKAFSHKGKTKFGHAFVHLYSIDSNIRGHEILVASSNNKAVENISQELPTLDAIDDSVLSDGYFSTTSDALAEKENSTWGLIAAVLGNASNRNAFRKSFWDDEVGLKNYLKVASGTPVIIEKSDEKTGEIIKRLPFIIEKESPPNGKPEALARWKVAQKKFNTSLKKVDSLLTLLTVGRKAYYKIIRLERKQDKVNKNLHEYSNIYTSFESKHLKAITAQNKIEDLLKNNTLLKNQYKSKRPNFLFRLFKTQKWTRWKSSYSHFEAEEKSNADKLKLNQQEVKLLSNQLEKVKNKLNILNRAKHKLSTEIENANKSIASARNLAGVNFVDTIFLAKNREELHKSVPWLSKEVQHARDKVFEASIELHRAFIDCAAKPLRHNLMALMQIFIGSSGDSILNSVLNQQLSILSPELGTRSELGGGRKRQEKQLVNLIGVCPRLFADCLMRNTRTYRTFPTLTHGITVIYFQGNSRA